MRITSVATAPRTPWKDVGQPSEWTKRHERQDDGRANIALAACVNSMSLRVKSDKVRAHRQDGYADVME